MITDSCRAALRAAALLTVAALAGCESGETIAPDGSTLTVTANPTNIVTGSLAQCLSILGVTPCGTADVVATVSSKLGSPLPDQDVRFTSTAGKLFTGSLPSIQDATNVPIPTDKFGNAHVTIISSSTATVNARSGAATRTITLQTIPGNIGRILLDFDTTTSGCSTIVPDVTSCSDRICLVATVEDSANPPNPLQGVQIVFKLQNNVSGSNTFSGGFVPAQPTTDVNGEAPTTFTPSSTCPGQCGGNKPCQAEIVAATLGGFTSVPLQLNININ